MTKIVFMRLNLMKLFPKFQIIAGPFFQLCMWMQVWYEYFGYVSSRLIKPCVVTMNRKLKFWDSICIVVSAFQLQDTWYGARDEIGHIWFSELVQNGTSSLQGQKAKGQRHKVTALLA